MNKGLKAVLVGVLGLSLVACTSKSDESNKVYKIACDAKYAPFSMEVNGKYVGIDVEILSAIAKEANFKYDLTPMDFSGVIPGLISSQLDGAIAGISITDERKKQVDFSEGYYQAGVALVANKKNTDIKVLSNLKGKKAAIKKGTVGSQFAEANASKYGFKYDYYDDTPSMMMAVKNGSADFLFEDHPVISYQIKTGEQPNLKVAIDYVGERPYYGFAVKKGKNSTLLKKFNEGLAAIRKNGTYDKIIKKYVG